MMKLFWYKYFKHPILINDGEDGIKSFTERKISDNVNELKKKITSLNSNPIIDVEHNTEHENVVISELAFRENRRRRNVLSIIIIILSSAEIFLNYISFLVVIPGGTSHPFWFEGMRWLGTITLTVGSIMVIEAFFDSFLYNDIIALCKLYGITVNSVQSRRKLIIWALLSLVLLVVIGFIVEKRANAVERNEKDLAYYGVIILSLSIPIISGMLAYEWKMARKICIAASNKRRHQSVQRQNAAAKIGDKGKIANSRVKFFSDSCSRYWKEINDFKSVKVAFDKKKGKVPENLGRHKVHVDDYKSYQDYIESILNGNY